MAEQHVTGPTASVKRLFIKPAEHRRRLNISRTTEWKLRRTDPDHPQPIAPFGYLEEEHERYVRLVIARARGANDGRRA
jgi:hypothetical protein